MVETISRFASNLARFFSGGERVQNAGDALAERTPQDYELYYWGWAPGPWY